MSQEDIDSALLALHSDAQKFIEMTRPVADALQKAVNAVEEIFPYNRPQAVPAAMDVSHYLGHEISMHYFGNPRTDVGDLLDLRYPGGQFLPSGKSKDLLNEFINHAQPNARKLRSSGKKASNRF